MERALDEAAKANDEARRLEFIALAAKVRAQIHVRRARRAGASLRQIEAATGIPKDTADRICKRPEPTMPERQEP